MRFLQFYLSRFGHFTDVGIDLSGGARGVHLICGENETGKSTLLRAFRAFLFGFPERSPDDFLHGKSELLVGAKIADEDGAEMILYRRKGRKNTLLDEEHQPVDESVLRRLLGDISEDLYVKLFGLDHEELSKESAAILEGGGELGEALFSSALGGVRLSQLLREFESEASDLFRPMGKKQSINVDVSAFRKAKKEFQEATLTVRELQQAREDLEHAQARAAALRGELGELRRRQSLIERQTRAKPRAGEFAELVEQMERLGALPDLPESFAEDRRELQSQTEQCSKQLLAVEDDIAALEKSLEGLCVDERLLEAASEIEVLERAVGKYSNDREAVEKLEAKLASLEAEARRLWSELRPGLDFAQLQELSVDRSRLEEWRAIASDYEKARGIVRQYSVESGEWKAKIETLESRLERLPVWKSSEAWAVLDGLSAESEERLNEVRVKAQVDARDIEARTHRLLGAERPESVELLSIPSSATIDRFVGLFRECEENIKTRRRDLESAESAVTQARRELEELQAGGAIPRIDDLLEAREHRDSGWGLVKKRLSGEASEAEEAEFRKDATLESRYEEASTEADRVADALCTQSERVARVQVFEARCAEAESRLQSCDQALQEARKQRSVLDKEWAAEWPFPSKSPEEMSAWRRDFDDLLERIQSSRELDARAQQLAKDVMSLRSRMMSLLEESNVSFDSKWPLPSLLDACRRRRDELREQESVRRETQRNLDEARLQANRLREKEVSANSECEAYRDRSVSLGRELGSEIGDANGALLTRWQRIVELRDLLATTKAELEFAESHRVAFEDAVLRLMERVQPGETSERPEVDLAELSRRLKVAANAAVRKEEWGERLRDVTRRRELLIKESDRLSHSARRLCELAGVDGLEELKRVEERWTAYQGLSAKKESLRRQLVEDAAGQGFDEFLGEVARLEIDRLSAEAVGLAGEIARLEEEQAEKNRQIGSAEKALEQLETGQGAADSAIELESLRVRIASGARAYARRHMAARLLRGEVERFREAHQGPVLQRASEFFEELTLGRFVGLSADYDAMDRTILVALRARDRIPIEGLSDGSRDQLYLSLRLASLERRLESQLPLPLICDDVLVHFDDARSGAAFKVLSDLANKTQVILLTHHRHLGTVARQAIDAKSLQNPSFQHLEEIIEDFAK